MVTHKLQYVGLAVRTADGANLGVVKEIARRSFDPDDRHSFKVDAPWRRDYWLDSDDVSSVDYAEGVVWLRFRKAELGEHRKKNP